MGDIYAAIDYFYSSGIIGPEEAEVLKNRYLPREIDHWYMDGIISAQQYEIIRKGYSSNIQDINPHERIV